MRWTSERQCAVASEIMANPRLAPPEISIRMLRPRKIQKTLDFAFVAYREGFTRELTMPLCDFRITSGAHQCGLLKPG